MANIYPALCFGLILAVCALSKVHEKQTCQEFTEGTHFDDSQAYGTWHLLMFPVDNITSDQQCVGFRPITHQERKNLSDHFDKYVENLKWENMTLKMEIPCDRKVSKFRTHYFLERLEDNGSYRAMKISSMGSAKEGDLPKLHRYPMSLKMVESQYLGLMDCHEHYVFLMGRLPSLTGLDDRLDRLVNPYWAEQKSREIAKSKLFETQ